MSQAASPTAAPAVQPQAPANNALAPYVSKPLEALNPQEMTLYCREKPEEAAAKMTALLRCNTAELPGTAFVRRNPDMTLQRVTRRVKLTESRKEIVTFNVNRGGFVDGRWKDKWVKACDMTAIGYRALNNTVGLHCFNPPIVIVDGVEQPNPYIACDPIGRNPTIVYVRRVVVGPARDTGNLVATDLMLRFDLRLYLIETLLAKHRKIESEAHKDEFLVWSTMDDRPNEKGWKFYSVESDVGIWVNIKNRGVQAAFGDHNSRMKFVERIAQSIAERNAFKAHPGMPPSVEMDSENSAGVQVVGWTNAANQMDLEKLRRAVNTNTLQDHAEVHQVVIEKTEAADHAAAEAEAETEIEAEAREIQEATGESQEQQTEPEQKPEQKEDAPKADRAELLAQAQKRLEEFNEAFGRKATKAELDKRYGIKGPLSEASDEQLAKMAEDTPL
jgi:hypothetical protein